MRTSQTGFLQKGRKKTQFNLRGMVRILICINLFPFYRHTFHSTPDTTCFSFTNLRVANADSAIGRPDHQPRPLTAQIYTGLKRVEYTTHYRSALTKIFYRM